MQHSLKIKKSLSQRLAIPVIVTKPKELFLATLFQRFKVLLLFVEFCISVCQWRYERLNEIFNPLIRRANSPVNESMNIILVKSAG